MPKFWYSKKQQAVLKDMPPVTMYMTEYDMAFGGAGDHFNRARYRPVEFTANGLGYHVVKEGERYIPYTCIQDERPLWDDAVLVAEGNKEDLPIVLCGLDNNQEHIAEITGKLDWSATSTSVQLRKKPVPGTI